MFYLLFYINNFLESACLKFFFVGWRKTSIIEFSFVMISMIPSSAFN